MAKQLETKFKEKVQEKLKLLRPHIWFYKTQQVALRGIPDMIICINGEFEAWELKKDEGAFIEPLQEKILQDINRAGGTAHKVYPENFDYHYERLLKKLGVDNPSDLS